MPGSTLATVLSKVATSEDVQVRHERHQMAMSYMVTVIHFYTVGRPRFDVLDSRVGRAMLAGISKQAEHDPRQITSRFVITEDLPRPTYDLLRSTLGIDPRLLDDHRRNGHGDGFVGQADLDIDKAPRSSSMSISIPFELQIGPVDFPPFARPGKNDTVEDEIGGILKHHQLVNYLQYDWRSFSITKPLSAVFFSTYRRISFQIIAGSTPTVVLLMYPPLWNLQEFQASKFQFHTSPDLEFSPTYGAKTRDTFDACDEESPFYQLGQDYPIRTQQVLRRLIDDVGFAGIVGNDLTRWISDWITFNAYGSFEASAESSVRGWHYAKTQTNILSGHYLANKVLCEGLRTRITIKLHQMDKAHAELHLDPSRIPEASDISTKVSPHAYVAQQWFRSRRTLQWILDDIGHAFRGNESKLQIDLAMTQVEESRKAMQGTEVVKRLTALAFIFIPVSTVCSAFGMNVQELSGDLPPIWIFAVVAVAVALVTVICSLEIAGHMLWAILSLLHAMMTTWKDWWSDIYKNAFTRSAPFRLGVVSIGTNLAGVKLDSNQRPATKIRTLRGFLIRTLAVGALAPFWIIENVVSHSRSLEQRGKRFKARWPQESVRAKISRSL
ncbi:MAG: hypothetical protein LQ352_005563 [Teloschistes flavicans]|nr:MAG: hypothetical protein LQ352_005563 [Teloschistes flavicans]